jgi:exopolysaccharide production protein ExoZ
MIANLQVLRGLAALGVVFYHTAFLLPGDVHTEFQGVSIFFVISGFLMPYITRDSADRFLSARLIRIVPLYWMCTAFLFYLKGGHGVGNFLLSLFFIPYFDISGDPHPMLGVGWTLNIEMFFYILFAGAILINRRWAPVLAAAALIGLKYARDWTGCTSPACDLYAHHYTNYLVLGICVFYVWSVMERWLPKYWGLVAPAAFAFAILYLAYSVSPPIAAALQPFAVGISISDAMPALLVLAALALNSAGFACSWKPPLVLGDASYSLYLTHIFVIEKLRPYIDFAHNILALATVLIASAALACLVFYAIERPILRTIKHFMEFSRAWPAVGNPR